MPAIIQNMVQDVPEGRIVRVVFGGARGIVLQATSSLAATGYGNPLRNLDTNEPINPPLGTRGGTNPNQLFIRTPPDAPIIAYAIAQNSSFPIWREDRGGATDDILEAPIHYSGNAIPNDVFPSATGSSSLGYALPTDQVVGGVFIQRVFEVGTTSAILKNGRSYTVLAQWDWGVAGAARVLGAARRFVSGIEYLYFAFLRENVGAENVHEFGMARINVLVRSPGTGLYTVDYLGATETITKDSPALPGPPVKFNASATRACFVSDSPIPETGSFGADPERRTTTLVEIIVNETSWSWSVVNQGFSSVSGSFTHTSSLDPPGTAVDDTDRTTTRRAIIAADYDGNQLVTIELQQTITEVGHGEVSGQVQSFTNSTTQVTSLVWSTGQSLDIETSTFENSGDYDGSGGPGNIINSSSTLRVNNRIHVHWLEVVNGFWAGAREVASVYRTDNGFVEVLPYDQSAEREITDFSGEYLIGKYGTTISTFNTLGTRKLRLTFADTFFSFFSGGNPFPTVDGGNTVQIFDSQVSLNLYDALALVRNVAITFIGSVAITNGFWMGSRVRGVLHPAEQDFICSFQGYDSEAWANTYEGAGPPYQDHRQGEFDTRINLNGWNNGNIRTLVFQGVNDANPHVTVIGVA